MPVDSVEGRTVVRKRGAWLSVDWWAVLLAFVLALLVRVGVLEHVSW